MSILDDMDHEAKMSNWEDQPIMVRVRELERKLAEAEARWRRTVKPDPKQNALVEQRRQIDRLKKAADKAEAEHRAWALTANARMADAVKLAAERDDLTRKLAEAQDQIYNSIPKWQANDLQAKLTDAERKLAEAVEELKICQAHNRMMEQSHAAHRDKLERELAELEGNVALARDPKRNLTP